MARLYLVHPNAKWEGCLTAVCNGENNVQRLQTLERQQEKQTFRVRAVLADSVPLSGEPDDLIAVRPFRRIRLNEDPLTIHLHRGGRKVWFFTLFSDGSADRFLSSIEVAVESRYPRSALRLGRTALSIFLDTLSINWDLPATIARLDLLVDGQDSAIVSEIVFPYHTALEMGPLGGFDQTPLFTPWLAVLREAMTATSPYWRLMCAWRAYDGVRYLRKEIRDRAEHLKISERLPKDPEIDVEALRAAGIDPPFLAEMRRASDLFSKVTTMRDGVAHFLLDSGEHVNFSDGGLYSDYSVASAILLDAATKAIVDLQRFYARNLEQRRGSIMPDKQQAHQYPVRDPEDG